MNTTEQKVSQLKTFLVTRFLAVIAFVYVADLLVDVIYVNVITPLFRNVLKANDIVLNGERFSGIFGLLLSAVWREISGVLPSRIATPIGNAIYSFTADRIQAPAFISEYGQGFESMYYQTILMLALIMFLLTIFPYLAGAWWYCRNVARKMQEIREDDAERKAEYDRQRNLLFSDIAHDIKTPITTVCGYSKAMMDGIVKEEKKQEYLQAIHSKSMRISNLITMLFEYVKLDSVGFQLHQEECDLAELVRENIIMVYTDAEEKHMEIEIDVPDEEMPVYADKVQLSRIVTNLLTNAIKYLSPGDVIKVTASTINNGKDYLVYVGDTGVQIEDSLAACIFDPFSRGDSARQTTGGSGLGLSIASKLAQLHGGSLTLNRECNDGCTKAFEIRIPVLERSGKQ